MRWTEHEKNYRLRFDNGISVELLRDGRVFHGLGQVKSGRRKLRSAELPVLPFIATPDGYEVTRLEMEDVERAEESVTINLRPFVAPVGRMEWLCYDGQDRWRVSEWARQPDRDRGGTVQLTLSAVERNLGGIPFAGFSYSYKFRSRKYRVYRIHDRATWELGGSATDNSFWMAGPFNPPRKKIRNKDDSFTTAWRRGGPEGEELQQFLPLFTVLQGFTFQFDRRGLLVTTFEEPFHCRSLFHKEAGANYLVHWHQLCADLEGCVGFPALQVLCADRPAETELDRANEYRDVRQDLREQYQRQAGVTRPLTVSSGCLAGSGPDVRGVKRGLDALARCACERVYVPDLMSACSPARDTVLAVQDACKQVQAMVELVHARGLQIALSLADCCSEWLVAESAGEERGDAPAGDALVESALCNTVHRELLLAHMRRIRQEFGVDALFADSPLASLADQFEWQGADGTEGGSPAGTIRSLERGRTELTAALQGVGYECLLAEAGGLATPGVAAPRDMPRACEFMFRDGVFRFPDDRALDSEEKALDLFFRACANRVVYMPTYDLSRGIYGSLDGWWHEDFAIVNRAYQAVREYMEDSRLLPADRGVLWRGSEPDVRVLWSYRQFKWVVGAQAKVFDVIQSEQVELDEDTFAVRPYGVYLAQNAREPAGR